LGTVQENDDLILTQVGFGELTRIFGCRHLKAVLFSQFLEGGFSRLDAAVSKTSSLAEDEDRFQRSFARWLRSFNGVTAEEGQTTEEKGDDGHGISLSRPDVRRWPHRTPYLHPDPVRARRFQPGS
jgi:hypothetical protein